MEMAGGQQTGTAGGDKSARSRKHNPVHARPPSAGLTAGIAVAVPLTLRCVVVGGP
jgi:hypothetical protein